MNYRAEIDGLRAFAVLPVILFHAGFDYFSGGFVGVDVFFVISGYLITSIILSDMEQGRFSLVRFYERRVRRILPALLFVCTICIPIAWMLLLPSDMKVFSRSIVAVMTFSSNILFWYESGYFDTAAELKPLLHTWSLAIEEQYYIIFPLFLLLTWRLGERRILALLSGVFVVSFVAADWGSLFKPNATFYLLPTRGWELLLGGFVAFYLRGANLPERGPLWFEQALSILGLAMIVYAVLMFDAHTRFPSIYALAPCLGTVFIILFANQGTLVNRLLSTPALVGIGLISYSAYLWHQPVFAFTKYYLVREPDMWLMLILCLVVLPMAFLSWHFIEKPFRRRHRFSRRAVFSTASLFSLVLILLGMIGYLTNGYENTWLTRQSSEVSRLYTLLSRERERDLQVAADIISHDNGDCRFNTQQLGSHQLKRIRECYNRYGRGIVILGDSHATDLFGVVSASNKTEDFVIGVTKGGCRPHTPASGCHYSDFLSLIQRRPELFSRVIYEQAGFYLLRSDKELGSRNMFAGIPLSASIKNVYPNRRFLESVHDYLKLVDIHVPVLWFGSRVEPHISDQDVFKLGCTYPFRLRENQFEVFRSLDVAIEKLSKESGDIEFLSQNKVFDYQFPRDFMTCQESYWTGGDHLSESGEAHFGKRYDLLNHSAR